MEKHGLTYCVLFTVFPASPHYDGVKTPPTLTLHTPTSHPHSSRMSVESRNGSAIHKEEGGEGGAGEGDEGCGVVRSVSDEVVTNRHQVAKERDSELIQLCVCCVVNVLVSSP